MNNKQINDVRKPVLAGLFYPAEKETLINNISGFLSNAAFSNEVAPKALIAPHAGYVCSGQVAANAYIFWRSQKNEIKRVVIIGPSHRVALKGIALPSARSFKTPLGEVVIDREAVNSIVDLPQIVVDDAPHEKEHSIEVHIPFLQEILGDFKLIPLLTGAVSGDKVAEVIERLWGDKTTRFLVSSDLSHFHNYEEAQRRDEATAKAIEDKNPAKIDNKDACGCRPISGMLISAMRHDLCVERLDLRNSGDSIGRKDQVVGYGAWAFYEKKDCHLSTKNCEERNQDIICRESKSILKIAAKALIYSVKKREVPRIDISSFKTELKMKRATFVTLNKNGKLRGCIGSVQAKKPLIVDVVENTYKAAIQDPRFLSVKEEELVGLHLTISVLSTFKKISFSSEDDLRLQLRPQVDGLIIMDQGKSSLFLPEVWKSIPRTSDFLNQLKLKAGLNSNHWTITFKAWRFTTTCLKTSIRTKSQ